MQPEDVREPPRRDREAGACSSVYTATRRRRGKELAKFSGHDAEEHAGETSSEQVAVASTGVKRRVAMLQKQSLLRVHCHRLGRRTSKQLMVDELRPLHEATVAHTACNIPW